MEAQLLKNSQQLALNSKETIVQLNSPPRNVQVNLRAGESI